MSHSNNEIPREHWPESMEIAKKCGCVCHYTTALHFRSCCGVTYFRVDLAEKTLAEVEKQ